jgi:hypothetical protein
VITLSELSFSQTVQAGLLNAVFTAVFVGAVAALVVKRYEQRSATRAALRELYAQLLAAQRESREASLKLARRGGESVSNSLNDEAVLSLSRFLALYHRLNLDASRAMWADVRGLRHVLEEMLTTAQAGQVVECEALADIARDARQNLQRSFRRRLGHWPLQHRRDLGAYDKRRSHSAGSTG